jgi:hypothetical protein
MCDAVAFVLENHWRCAGFVLAAAALGGAFTMVAPRPATRRPIARWVWLVGALFAVTASVWGYYVFRTQRIAAHSVIDELHAQMRLGDNAAIFAASDPAYQAAVGQAKTDELFAFIRDKMGDPQTSTLAGWNVQTTTSTGQQKTLVFETQFAKGSGTETLVLHKVGGRWELLSYNVRSKLIRDDDLPADLKN